MESRDYQEGFEDFLQEKADQYKLYPSDRVWNAISGKIHPRSKWSYLVVAAIFIGLGIGGKVYDSSLVTEPTHFISENDTQMASSIGDSQAENAAASNARVIAMQRPSRSSANSFQEQVSKLSKNASSADQISSQNNGSPVLASSLNTGNETRVITMFETETNEFMHADEPGTSREVNTTTQETTTANNILEDAALSDATEFGPAHLNSMATVNTSLNKELTFAKIPAPEKAGRIKVLKPRHLNIGWQMYASPTVSYRKLSGEGMSYYNGAAMTSVFTQDVEKSVRHKPAIGFELGTALTYATGPRFRFKTGVQLNINRYDIEAFSYVPEVAPLTRGGIGHSTINAISRYRSDNGFSKTWLNNQHIMMAIPLGAEITLFGSENIKFNIGGTLQPTFVLNNQAYMISTNMKNYAQEPSLYKKFNVAAGAEAYLSIKSRSVKWMIGPQFRYQIFSSYKKEYPIDEHLIDYGFKIGISR